jgi:hypothetical protein
MSIFIRNRFGAMATLAAAMLLLGALSWFRHRGYWLVADASIFVAVLGMASLLWALFMMLWVARGDT